MKQIDDDVVDDEREREREALFKMRFEKRRWSSAWSTTAGNISEQKKTKIDYEKERKQIRRR